MLTVILLVSTLAAISIVAWLLRHRLAESTLAYLPQMETMKKVILLTSIAGLTILALLPEILCIAALVLATRNLRFFVTVLTLSVALVACIGCSKQPEPQKPHEIHWQGPETSFVGKTVFPPENTGIPKEKP